jgi:hypothetical protein
MDELRIVNVEVRKTSFWEVRSVIAGGDEKENSFIKIYNSSKETACVVLQKIAGVDAKAITAAEGEAFSAFTLLEHHSVHLSVIY